MEKCWKYKGKCLETPPEGFYGYIYVITDDKGKKYFGKKAFSHRKKTKLSKKARKVTRKRIKISSVDSGWLDYWGSCKPLLEYISENGTKGFKREIIKLCKDRQSLAYWEISTLITEKVLFRDDTWNGNISGRYFKNKIHV